MNGIFFFLYVVTGVVGLSSLVLLAIVLGFVCERIRVWMRLRRFLFALRRSRELLDAYLNMASKAASNKLFGGEDMEATRYWPRLVRRRYLNRSRLRGTRPSLGSSGKAH